jgi:hypothetical protein
MIEETLFMTALYTLIAVENWNRPFMALRSTGWVTLIEIGL